MGEVRRVRRFYLLKRFAAYRFGDRGLEAAWRGKQQEITIIDGVPVHPLPTDFPSRAALVDAGYETAEDIDGADAKELSQNVALNAIQSEAVIAAAAALL